MMSIRRFLLIVLVLVAAVVHLPAARHYVASKQAAAYLTAHANEAADLDDHVMISPVNLADGQATFVSVDAAPAGVSANNYVELDVRLRDVDLKQLLAALPKPAPVDLGGHVSIEMRIGIPVDTPANAKAYRLRGLATLPWLKLGDLELEDVRVRVEYGDGVLRLHELHARVPLGSGSPDTTAVGTIDAAAQLEWLPAGNVVARVSLSALPLAPLARVLTGSNIITAGAFSGAVTARAPVERMGTLDAWTAVGNFRAQHLSIGERLVEMLSGGIRLEEGTLAVSGVKAESEGISFAAVSGRMVCRNNRLEYRLNGEGLGGRFDLSGVLPSPEPGASDTAADARLHVNGVRLDRLWHVLHVEKTWRPVQGDVDGDVTLRRETETSGWRGSGAATVSQGRIMDVEVSSLRLPFAFAADSAMERGRVDIRDASGGVARGRVSGAATVTWDANNRVAGRLQFADVDLQTLLRQINYRGQERGGRVNGRIEFGGNDVNSLDDVTGTLDATLHSNRVIQLSGTGSVRNPSIRVEAVSLLPERPVRALANRLGVSLP